MFNLIEKIDGCKKNPEDSSASKLTQKIPSVFLMSTTSSLKASKMSMMYTEVEIT